MRDLDPTPNLSSTLGYLDRLGPYVVLERLAVGAQGEVYLASEGAGGRRVALKVLPPHALADVTSRRRLRREARLLARLEHPNIVRLLAAGEAAYRGGSLDYLAMERIEGVALSASPHAVDHPEPTMLSLARQVAGAVAAVHAVGLVHRDIKSGNFMVDERGHVKLIDFGLAFEQHDEPSKRRPEGWTRSAPLAYQAPELLRGGAPGPRSDVYALGVVLYRLATGARPFSSRDEGDLLTAVLERPPTAPRALVPTLDRGLEAMILRCLAKDPVERYPSAVELSQAFDSVEAIPGAP